MSKEVLQHIDLRLRRAGFSKVPTTKGNRIYTIGDNYFNITKRFARFSIHYANKKYSIAAITAVATRGGDRVSRIDWAESAKVTAEKFDTVAMRIMNNLLTQCKQKPAKE